MNGKEALKKAKKILMEEGFNQKVLDNLNIIEKDLDRLMVYDIQQEQTDKWLENARKKLEVLEIIKEKRVNMSLIYFQKDYLDYNEHIVRMGAVTASKTLTETEFNKIKEWLENE